MVEPAWAKPLGQVSEVEVPEHAPRARKSPELGVSGKPTELLAG
jgi:hypothetical protein